MIDLTTPSIYLDGIPHDRFAEVRAMPGVMWHPYGDNGFWAVTRHREVAEVSKHPEVFSSAIGHTNLWDLEADALEARRSIIDSDAPDHTRLRRLVSRAFTPRNILVWEETARSIAGELLDDFIRQGGGNWVDMVAAPLPIRVILTILGVPVEDADFLVELSDYLIEGTTDKATLPADAFGNTTPLRLLPFNSPASHALFEYGERIGAERLAEPRNDLVTHLVLAEADGDRLSMTEYRNFFQLLVFAGNETTRTAMIHGGEAFATHPDQWSHLVNDHDLMDRAVDEVLRWSTPVLHMRRTTTRDTVLDGTEIAAGDKVVVWYASANRDPDVFDDPFSFDVTRAENPHFAFGGGGPHFCLGAFLARMEIRILFEEMLKRGLVLSREGEPVRAPSNFVHGVLSLDLGVLEGRVPTGGGG